MDNTFCIKSDTKFKHFDLKDVRLIEFKVNNTSKPGDKSLKLEYKVDIYLSVSKDVYSEVLSYEIFKNLIEYFKTNETFYEFNKTLLMTGCLDHICFVSLPNIYMVCIDLGSQSLLIDFYNKDRQHDKSFRYTFNDPNNRELYRKLSEAHNEYICSKP